MLGMRRRVEPGNGMVDDHGQRDEVQEDAQRASEPLVEGGEGLRVLMRQGPCVGRTAGVARFA